MTFDRRLKQVIRCRLTEVEAEALKKICVQNSINYDDVAELAASFMLEEIKSQKISIKKADSKSVYKINYSKK